MSVIFRQAQESDTARLVELEMMLSDFHHQLDPSYWSKGDLKSASEIIHEELKRPLSYWIVAEDQGTIVGFCAGMINDTLSAQFVTRRMGHIMSAYVLPEYRGKGIVREGVKKIFDYFKSENVHLVELTVDTKNMEGVLAWERLGFKEERKRMRTKI